jgi:hypothetical protein
MTLNLETVRQDWIASKEERNPAIFPELYNLSAAFLYQFLPYPKTVAKPEFLFLPAPKPGTKNSGIAEFAGIMGQWNIAWEAGQLRSELLLSEDERLRILKLVPALASAVDRNVYLLPDTKKTL